MLTLSHVTYIQNPIPDGVTTQTNRRPQSWYADEAGCGDPELEKTNFEGRRALVHPIAISRVDRNDAWFTETIDRGLAKFDLDCVFVTLPLNNEVTTQVFAREAHLTLAKKPDAFKVGSLCPGAKTQLTAAPFIVYIEAMTVATKNRFCDLARERENLTLIPFQRTGPISPHRTPPPDTAVLQHQTISGSALLDILRSIEDDEENDVRAPKVIHVLVFGQKLGGSRIPDAIPWLEDAIDLVASSCDIESHDVHLNMRLDIAFTFQNPEPHDIILFENTGTPYGKRSVFHRTGENHVMGLRCINMFNAKNVGGISAAVGVSKQTSNPLKLYQSNIVHPLMALFTRHALDTIPTTVGAIRQRRDMLRHTLLPEIRRMNEGQTHREWRAESQVIFNSAIRRQDEFCPTTLQDMVDKAKADTRFLLASPRVDFFSTTWGSYENAVHKTFDILEQPPHSLGSQRSNNKVNSTMAGLYQVMLNQIGYKVHNFQRRQHQSVLTTFGDTPEVDTDIATRSQPVRTLAMFVCARYLPSNDDYSIDVSYSKGLLWTPGRLNGNHHLLSLSTPPHRTQHTHVSRDTLCLPVPQGLRSTWKWSWSTVKSLNHRGGATLPTDASFRTRREFFDSIISASLPRP